MLKALPIALLMAFMCGDRGAAREPTTDEKPGIESVVRAQGFEAWSSIDLGDEEVIVEGIRTSHAGECVLVLSASTYEVKDLVCDG